MHLYAVKKNKIGCGIPSSWRKLLPPAIESASGYRTATGRSRPDAAAPESNGTGLCGITACEFAAARARLICHPTTTVRSYVWMCKAIFPDARG
jgi:hypothetical protein